MSDRKSIDRETAVARLIFLSVIFLSFVTYPVAHSGVHDGLFRAGCLSIAAAEEAAVEGAYSAPADAIADEPFAGEFSAVRAAEYLDSSAGYWVETRRCAACHTVPPYLMARPLLPAAGSAAGDVRRFVEQVVVDGREGEPQLPRDGISAITVQIAAALAINDRLTTGKLHPVTRQALDRMWQRQRDDGSWEWPFRDVPPIKIDEHYGVAWAALAAGLAPEEYARSDAARKGLDGVRRYLREHSAESLHQRALVAWASLHVDDLASGAEREKTRAALLEAQRPDGGWSLANLVENQPSAGAEPDDKLRELQRQPGYRTKFLTYVGRSGAYASSLDSDGYATGFAVYVARQLGIPADDARLARGVTWLKNHQRESGRWFTPSQGNHTRHYISNAGTAWSVMALDACGALK